MQHSADCAPTSLQPRRERRPAPPIPDQFVRQLLEHAVTPVFMVAGAELWSDTRGQPHVAFARQVAMYLAHVGCRLTFTEVGQVFARDRTTVAHACGIVEDLRDDPVFDRSLELLESVLRSLSPGSAPFPVSCTRARA